MNEPFQIVSRRRTEIPGAALAPFSPEEAQKARKFHESFAPYQRTPLWSLPALARALGVGEIRVKDESLRFGLNAFKVLGGSYAIGRYVADRLGGALGELTADNIRSPAVRRSLGEICFVTATDGNHGRGVAWTARQLGQRAVVYLPRGTKKERLDNIRSEGAEASVVDCNYDGAVRLAERSARENGWVLVQDTAWPGYEEIPRRIMQGYTTIGLEIADQLEEAGAREPTHLFLQAGVGSMAGALAAFFCARYGEKRPFIGVVEPNAADCLLRTARADDGKLRAVTGDMNTIMAGLACGEPCASAWELLRHAADAFLGCPDGAAADGMRILAAPARGDTPIVSGESGASALGCVADILLCGELRGFRDALGLDANSRLLFISTEGDTDRENYRNIVWRGAYPGLRAAR